MPPQGWLKSRYMAFEQYSSAENASQNSSQSMFVPTDFTSLLQGLKVLERQESGSGTVVNPRDLASTNGSVTPLGTAIPVDIASVYLELKIRNNEPIPAKVTLYWYRCKCYTADSPITTANKHDQSYNLAGWSGKLNVYITDMPEVSKVWTLVKTNKTTVQGGDEFVDKYSIKKHQFKYAEYNDNGALTYEPGSIVCVIRQEGIIGRNTNVKSIVGITGSVLDIQRRTHFCIKYESSDSIRRFNIFNEDEGVIEEAGVQPSRR